MFGSYRDLVSDVARRALIEECEFLFTATSRKESSAYSEGQTFWIGANDRPTCAIEAFCLDVFAKHSHNVVFDRSKSGCEFWPLVIDEDSDVGAHFDKDYGAEDDNQHLYPFRGTVTYLSGTAGAPTTFFECVEFGDFPRAVPRAMVSFVEEGKHVVFDGTLLHLAASKMCISKSNKSVGKRVTLLINVWLDHRPMDAVAIQDSSKSFTWKELVWPREDVLPMVAVANCETHELEMPLDKRRIIRFRTPVSLNHSCILEFGQTGCVFEKRKKKKKDAKKKDKSKISKKKKKNKNGK